MALIDLLDSFNRKERYFLVGEALGNPHFELGAAFRERLSRALAIDFAGRTWAAMDYHLDWIQTALLLHSGLDEVEVHENRGFVTGTRRRMSI